MNKKSINIFLYSLAILLVVAAGIVYYMKESARKEYEHAKSEYEARPEMPIEITYREALLGPGLVATFKNVGNRHLAVIATLRNPTMEKEQNFRIDIAPGSVKEIGHSEGWSFASGDIIKLVHNEYKTKIVKLP